MQTWKDEILELRAYHHVRNERISRLTTERAIMIVPTKSRVSAPTIEDGKIGSR